MTFKLAGAVILFSIIAYETTSFSMASKEGERISGYRGFANDAQQHGLVSSRDGSRAFISPFLTPSLFMPSRRIVIRKSVSPNDLRLRYGKRSGPVSNLNEHSSSFHTRPDREYRRFLDYAFSTDEEYE